jgi:hypothetical protein
LRKCIYFIWINLRVVADAAFHRPAGIVVLHAETDEGGQGAVVFGDGAFHLDLAERDDEALLELGVEAEQPRGLPEVAAGGDERVHGSSALRQGSRGGGGKDPPF